MLTVCRMWWCRVQCKFMSSAKLPLWLVFENADPDGDKIMVMFKAGDDLRQDTVTLQLIRVMDSLWRQGGMDLRLSPYRCISTWHDGGMLEIVRNAATTAEIQKKYGGKFGAYKDSTFDDWIRDNNPKQAAYQRAVDVFTVSAAGYVVATYLMGIGDRHNDNIMVKKSGHYFHIDFGHFLGNFKYAGFIKRYDVVRVFAAVRVRHWCRAPNCVHWVQGTFAIRVHARDGVRDGRLQGSQVPRV